MDIEETGLYFFFPYDVLKLMDADGFWLLYSYSCLFIFFDNDPN